MPCKVPDKTKHCGHHKGNQGDPLSCLKTLSIPAGIVRGIHHPPLVMIKAMTQTLGTRFCIIHARPYAIRAPDYRHPAALSPSANDENERGPGETGEMKKLQSRDEYTAPLPEKSK